MNSRRKQLDSDHRQMTELCKEENCLVCGRYGCVPAHTTHRGMGGGKAGWSIEEIVPLCSNPYPPFGCHQIYDSQNGASRTECFRTDIVRAIVERKKDKWRKDQRDRLGDDEG